MKNFILFTLLVCQTYFSISQDTTLKKEATTNLEKINLKIGAILKKQYFDVYDYSAKGFFSTGNFKIKILKIYDAASAIQTSGLYISTIDVGTRYIASKSYTGYIDSDEVDALLSFLEFLETNDSKTEETYTEYIFNSKGVQFYSYWGQNQNKKWQWNYGIKVDKFYEASSIPIEIKNISEIKNKIKENLSKLKR